MEVTLAGLMITAVALALAVYDGFGQGNVPEWIAAISTFFAVLAAIWAGWSASRTLELELQRERRSQAVQVAAWPSDPQLNAYSIVPTTLFVTVRNESPLPVYDLSLEVFIRDVGPELDHTQTYGRRRLPIVLPRAAELEQGGATVEPVSVSPGDVGNLTLLIKFPPFPEVPFIVRRRYVQVAFEFQDSSGQRWRRDTNGRLAPR